MPLSSGKYNGCRYHEKLDSLVSESSDTIVNINYYTSGKSKNKTDVIEFNSKSVVESEVILELNSFKSLMIISHYEIY